MLLLSSSSSLSTPPLSSSGLNSNQDVVLDNKEEERKKTQVLRRQQQRLLLLFHVSRCTWKNGSDERNSICPVTPHCATMKTLWMHMQSCKDRNCTFRHCLSSRCVLTHYKNCKDPACKVCRPVRETIRRSAQQKQSDLLSAVEEKTEGTEVVTADDIDVHHHQKEASSSFNGRNLKKISGTRSTKTFSASLMFTTLKIIIIITSIVIIERLVLAATTKTTTFLRGSAVTAITE